MDSFEYYYAEVDLRDTETARDRWGTSIIVSRIPVPEGYQLYSVIEVTGNKAKIALVK